MNIYLDIDGVLLDKNGEPTKGLEEFLNYVTNYHNCYWLTTNCQGDVQTVINHFRNKSVTTLVMDLLLKVQPTIWSYKTDAINFDEDFLWLDDNLFLKEKWVLEEKNAMPNFVHFDLRNNPYQLLEVLDMLVEMKS